MTKPSQALTDVYVNLCRGVNTPRSLACLLLFESGEFKQLFELDINPSDYHDPHTFHGDYAVTSYLRKQVDIDCGIDTDKVALAGFTSSEIKNKESNRSLATYDRNYPDRDGLLLAARSIISSVLGEFDLKTLLEGCDWGPGATFSLAATRATLATKICEKQISVTRRAAPYFMAAVCEDVHWARARGIQADGPCSWLSSEFSFVQGGRLSVVPKSAKTGRTIVVEPTGNLFLQKGVGALIRRRLRSVGIDLNDQGINQNLARQGWATIDIKDASNTVYRELVFQLLPIRWACYLDDIRSHAVRLPDQSWSTLEMFSSMGNGFTFELESLIFYAVSKAALVLQGSRARVSVYGDDIIVPETYGELVVKALESFRFQVNRDKTFTRGPFRESCGAHFFNGVNVTPVYQKEELYDEFSKVKAFNRLCRLASASGKGYRDRRFRGAAYAVLRSAKIMASRLDFEVDDGFGFDRHDLEAFPRLGAVLRSRFLPVSKKKACSHEPLLAYTLRRSRWPNAFQPTLASRRLRPSLRLLEGLVDPGVPFDGGILVRITSRPKMRLHRRSWINGTPVGDAPWV